MALGQFVIYLIPKEWALENNFNATLLYDNDDMFDTDNTWNTNQPDINIETYFSKFLSKSKSWSNNLLCFGNESGHDIQICVKNSKPESIQIRIDLTRDINLFVKNILTISNELNCVFFYPELKIMSEATKKDLYTSIKQSLHYKYIKNPHKFFNDLKSNI